MKDKNVIVRIRMCLLETDEDDFQETGIVVSEPSSFGDWLILNDKGDTVKINSLYIESYREIK